ncbi:hypothetical protein C8J56DRAFT_30669 [Mycena floridula]|nr:hypothetical protein C8J56DRAFT_30669 [Mycena floridula]
MITMAHEEAAFSPKQFLPDPSLPPRLMPNLLPSFLFLLSSRVHWDCVIQLLKRSIANYDEPARSYCSTYIVDHPYFHTLTATDTMDSTAKGTCASTLTRTKTSSTPTSKVFTTNLITRTLPASTTTIRETWTKTKVLAASTVTVPQTSTVTSYNGDLNPSEKSGDYGQLGLRADD